MIRNVAQQSILDSDSSWVATHRAVLHSWKIAQEAVCYVAVCCVPDLLDPVDAAIFVDVEQLRHTRFYNNSKDEYLQPLNQGLVSFGSATNFRNYVEQNYIPLEMPLLAKTTQERYSGVLERYLLPAFGELCLNELKPMTLQKYFTSMRDWKLSGELRDKIRTVLASVLRTAVKKYGLLITNPIEGIQLPPNKNGRRKTKPFLSPEQFDELVCALPEPYATMVYTATYSGLRISELIGLKWHDLGFDSIVVDERYCRGDWSQPKSNASNTTIGVDRSVIERIHSLKLLTVEIKWRGTRLQGSSQIQTREVGQPRRSGIPERARREADAR